MTRPPLIVTVRLTVAGLTETPIVVECSDRASRGAYPAEQINRIIGQLGAVADDARRTLQRQLAKALYQGGEQ